MGIQCREQVNQMWRNPYDGNYQHGCYKISIDLYQAGEYSWGIGAAARDAEGNVLAKATWKVACGKQVRLAASLSFRLSLCLAGYLCFREIEFESDCLEVSQALQHQDE